MPNPNPQNLKGKPGPGRPKGSKDKSYLTLQFWYDELMKDWGSLSPAQRAKLSKELMQMLVNKMKSMPGSPEESVSNIKEAQALLEQLEGGKGKTKLQGVSESSPSLKPPELA